MLLSCYELGRQPLSLASPLAFLTDAGYSASAVDTSVEELPEQSVRDAYLVAISVPMHTALRLGVQVAQRVRAINPGAHISFYGLYASLNSRYLLDNHGDSVISGEYEQPLLELVRGLERGGTPEGEGVETQNQPARPYLRRTRFQPPSRSSLPPLERYARLQDQGRLSLAGHVETTHGCLHTCLHCPLTPVYGGRLFAVPQDVVLGDVRTQVDLGAQHISFGDPDFLNGPTHSLRILRRMHAEFPSLTFDATIKIEHILEHRALFPELHALGCLFVVSAVESLSDEVLARLDKGHRKSDVLDAIEITRSVGISLRPSLLPFTPWATLDDYLELLDCFEHWGMLEQVDPVQYSIRLLVPPGSALLAELAPSGLLGDLDASAYTYRWRHPDPRMDQLQAEVARIAEEAEVSGADPISIFFELKHRAYEHAGKRTPKAQYHRGAPSPRLTESWFC